MDKRIGLTVIALDEAEALHGVEEFDRSGRLLTGELTLRTTTARAAAITTTIAATKAATFRTWFARTVFDGHRLAVDLQFGRRNLAPTINQREPKWLTFSQANEPRLLHSRDMNEHIFAAVIAHDETEAFLAVEEFYDTSAFTDDLGRHRRARSTAATATTAAKATASAAAAAKTVTTATETVTAPATAETIAAACSSISTIAVVTEAVALVPAAPAALTATPFIKTHALSDFPEFIVRKSIEPKHRTMGTWYSAQNHYAPSSRNSVKMSNPRAILIRRFKHLSNDLSGY